MSAGKFLVCQWSANQSELTRTQQHMAVVYGWKLLPQMYRRTLSNTQENRRLWTTNQGVACSNHAGCTKGFQKLRASNLDALFVCDGSILSGQKLCRGLVCVERSASQIKQLAGQLAYKGLNRYTKPGNHGQHTINLQATSSLRPCDC